MQEKTVLEDPAGEDDRESVGIQRYALLRCHADKRCHKAQGEKVRVLMLVQIVCKTADHGTCVKDTHPVFFIKCDRPGECLQG